MTSRKTKQYGADVTRKAVERASDVTAKVKEILRNQIFSGPTSVTLTPTQIREEIARGNTKMIRHAQQTMDEEEIMRLL